MKSARGLWDEQVRVRWRMDALGGQQPVVQEARLAVAFHLVDLPFPIIITTIISSSPSRADAHSLCCLQPTCLVLCRVVSKRSSRLLAPQPGKCNAEKMLLASSYKPSGIPAGLPLTDITSRTASVGNVPRHLALHATTSARS